MCIYFVLGDHEEEDRPHYVPLLKGVEEEFVGKIEIDECIKF